MVDQHQGRIFDSEFIRIVLHGFRIGPFLIGSRQRLPYPYNGDDSLTQFRSSMFLDSEAVRRLVLGRPLQRRDLVVVRNGDFPPLIGDG